MLSFCKSEIITEFILVWLENFSLTDLIKDDFALYFKLIISFSESLPATPGQEFTWATIVEIGILG